jgi:hypothetical protein
MRYPRADHVMLRVNKKIFICGGWEEFEGQRRLVSSIECYDIKTSTCNIVTHIPNPRYHSGITVFGNEIYFIGGFASDDIFRHTANAIDVYNIIEDKWFFLDKMEKPIWEHSLATIYVRKKT